MSAAGGAAVPAPRRSPGGDRVMTPDPPPFDPGDRYRDAARAYLAYGIVYWIGGAYLAMQGIGVRGSTSAPGPTWIGLRLGFLRVLPHLLCPPRRWFERRVPRRPDLPASLT